MPEDLEKRFVVDVWLANGGAIFAKDLTEA